MFTRLRTYFIAWLLGATFLSSVTAQSTVFNIPSSDVQSTGRVYLEADFMTHISSFDRGGFQLYGMRSVYGLSKRTEVGLNAFFINTSPAEPIEIQPNFKLQLYQNEKKGFALAVGTTAYIPVSQRSTSTTRAMIYAVGSKQLKGSFGPRLTGGAYKLIGKLEEGTTRQGMLLGYEQPVTNKITFVTDWSSGNNDYGYVAAGAGITLSSRSILYVGYNIGNRGRANNSMGIFYGYSF